MGYRPSKWVFFYLLMACCCVAILMLMVADYEVVYNGTRGGFEHLELVEVECDCIIDVTSFFQNLSISRV